MFENKQYVVEGKLEATFLSLVGETWSIKDLNGNPVCAFEKQKHGGFLAKASDGKFLGEIRRSGNLWKVRDAREKVLGTIRQAEISREERNRGLFILLLGLIIGPISVAFVLTLLTENIFIFLLGAAFTMFGLVLFGYLFSKGRFGRPKWLIESPSGQLLAEADDFTLGRHVEVIGSNGSIISRIEKKRGLAGFRDRCTVSISEGDIDPLLILGYAVVSTSRAKRQRESALQGFG